jgi:hypothetical protein
VPRRRAASVASAAEEAEDEEEEVEEVEVDPDGGRHVLVGAVDVAQAPGVEDEQAAEQERADAGDPEVGAALRKNRLSSEVPMSTQSPTVRNPPQALKSRRLTNA